MGRPATDEDENHRLGMLEPPKPLQSEVVFQSLREAIIWGEIGPNQSLNATQLARRFGTSKSPVRDALIRLSAEGLVEHEPQLGYVVRMLSPRDIRELLQVREILEGAAAGLAAQHRSEAQLKQLQELVARLDGLEHPQDTPAILKHNWAFHVQVARATGNNHLAEMVETIHGKLQRVLFDDLTRLGVKSVLEEHREIVAHIARQDAGGATRVMTKHLHATLERVLAF